MKSCEVLAGRRTYYTCTCAVCHCGRAFRIKTKTTRSFRFVSFNSVSIPQMLCRLILLARYSISAKLSVQFSHQVLTGLTFPRAGGLARLGTVGRAGRRPVVLFCPLWSSSSFDRVFVTRLDLVRNRPWWRAFWYIDPCQRVTL